MLIPPPKPGESEGGIARTEASKEGTLTYGRVLSAGPNAPGCKDLVGKIVKFDKRHAREVYLDPLECKEERMLYSVIAEVCQGVLSEEVARACRLPIPPGLDEYGVECDPAD